MLVVGLTGGIGSGKSSVAARLAEHGAHVLDADRIAREVVTPGTTGLQAVRERFGEQVVTDGALDRAALGRVVFADPAARADLEAIIHPLVGQRTADELAGLPREAWAVHDVPLLVELGYAPRYHLVVVVHAPEQVRVDRLVSTRGTTVEDAWSRVRAQASNQERRAVADAWLDNSGTPEQLRDQVDQLVLHRLEPLRRRLLARQPLRPGEELAAGPGRQHAPARVAARVRHLLSGAGAGDVSVEAVLADDGWCEVAARAEQVMASAPETLAAGGFVAVGESQRDYVAVDPGRPARLRLDTPAAS